MKTLDLIIGSFFLLILLYLIIKTRRNKDFEEFSVSKRNLGLVIIFASLSATFIGPGYSMALVRQGYTTGLFYLLVASAYGLSKIFEGAVVSGKMREKFTDAYSIGDIIAGKKSHNSKLLHVIVGIIAFGLLLGFSTVIAKAGGALLHSFFHVDPFYGVMIITAIVAVYSFFGGIKASIYTDAFQFVVFVIILPVLLLMAVNHPDFDGEMFRKNTVTLTETALKQTTFWQFFALIVTWFFGELLIPPTVNRILSTKTKNVAKKSLIYSGLFMIVWLAFMLIMGIVAYTNGITAENQDQILLIMGQKYLLYGLYGVFVVAMLSIVMSSLDSVINSASVVFVQDVFDVNNRFDQKKKLLYARISTLIIAVLAIILSGYFGSILQGLLFVYSIWAPAIVVVLLASVFLDKVYWQAGLASVLGGITAAVLWKTTPYNEKFPSILAGMLVSLVLYVIVHFYYKSKKK